LRSFSVARSLTCTPVPLRSNAGFGNSIPHFVVGDVELTDDNRGLTPTKQKISLTQQQLKWRITNDSFRDDT